MSSNHLIHPGHARLQPSESQDEDPSLAGFAPDHSQDQGDSILLGESVAIRRLRSQIQRIAPYFRTALIHGEVDTGKQLIARAVHALSPGAGRPFIVGNAGALAASIAGGNRSNAPHPAGSLLESARGGTLYLDGVGELTSSLQAALLRFIQACEERRATPAQGGRSGLRRPDTRILASSERDLRTLCAIGQFRQDLYARLSAVELFVPPLRQRIEDIPMLAASLLRRLAGQTGHDPKMLTQATLAQLQDRSWPGNLRELQRVIAQAAALAEGTMIEPRHLLSLVDPVRPNAAVQPAARIERLDEVIRHHVLEVLTRCGGNKLRAAELLGISRSTLYRMLDAGAASNGPLPE